MSTETPPHDTDEEPTRSQRRETGTGLDPNVAAAIAYVLGWLTGIVMYFVEPDDEYVRFHAAQSIVVFAGLTVVSVGLGVVQSAISSAMFATGPGGDVVFGLMALVFSLIGFVVWIAGFVVWLYLIVRTYQDRDPRVPVAAGIADGMV